MARGDDLAQIIAGCKSGDAGCFSEVVDAYASRCYGYFYRLTGNKDVSDDLLSELFVKLVEKIKTYKGGSFESWLFRIASNIFHDYLRGKQRQRRLLESQVKIAKQTLEAAEQLRRAMEVSVCDTLRARAALMGVEIRLLQERARAKPTPK